MIPVVLFYGFLAADPAALARTPQMRQALDYAKRIEPEIIAEQRRVCEIAAPTGQEEKRVEMVSGVNLYMLVSAFGQRDKMPVEKLVEKIVADGQKSIRDIRAMFLAAAGGR